MGPDTKPIDDSEDIDDESGEDDPEYYAPPAWLAAAVDAVLDEDGD